MIRLKSLLAEGVEAYKLSNGDWNYAKIESSTNASDVAALIRQSKGYINDDEAVAEAAFMAMAKTNIYDKVKSSLGQDPYAFVKSFMTTSTSYHKQSIDTSYKKIQAFKTKSTPSKNTTSNVTIKLIPGAPEITPGFIQLVKNWENSKDYKPGGWKPALEKWHQVPSPEGGTDSIAYGHKLTSSDIASNRFVNGISDETANTLMLNDLKIARQKAKALVPSYESLSTSTKQALINACYRGELSNTETPKTLKLMRAGQWPAAAIEYLNHDEYRSGGANIKNRMGWNAKQFKATKIK